MRDAPILRTRERETWEQVARQPAGVNDVIGRIQTTAAHLRKICEDAKLPLRPRRAAAAA